MAFSSGSLTKWEELQKLYQRISIERSRWEKTTTGMPSSSRVMKGVTIKELADLVTDLTSIYVLQDVANINIPNSSGQIINPSSVNRIDATIDNIMDIVDSCGGFGCSSFYSDFNTAFDGFEGCTGGFHSNFNSGFDGFAFCVSGFNTAPFCTGFDSSNRQQTRCSSNFSSDTNFNPQTFCGSNFSGFDGFSSGSFCGSNYTSFDGHTSRSSLSGNFEPLIFADFCFNFSFSGSIFDSARNCGFTGCNGDSGGCWTNYGSFDGFCSSFHSNFDSGVQSGGFSSFDGSFDSGYDFSSFSSFFTSNKSSQQLITFSAFFTAPFNSGFTSCRAHNTTFFSSDRAGFDSSNVEGSFNAAFNGPVQVCSAHFQAGFNQAFNIGGFCSEFSNPRIN